ncbi:Uncharacterised protein [Mycobacteroides abscessus subsp. abscessus]|nr:Uncharacterised protein [Mycobacteroides abscessus subsp. abscessus]
MPEAEQQGADCRHAPKAPGTRHGSVQHTTERKLFGDHRLQRDQHE